MKKFLALLVLAVVAGMFGTAIAHDVRDTDECREQGSGVDLTDQADRGAVCVAEGGMVLFYIGGEADPEQERGTYGPCGDVAVADNSVGNPNWHYTDSGPDGVPGTSDDVHHDCQ